MATVLEIDQGTTWGMAWPLTDPVTKQPLDLSGWTVRAQVRPSVDSPQVLHEWSTTLGNASVSGNEIVLSLAPAVSSAWTWRTGRFDVEATSPDNKVVRVAAGYVQVSPETTR